MYFKPIELTQQNTQEESKAQLAFALLCLREVCLGLIVFGLYLQNAPNIGPAFMGLVFNTIACVLSRTRFYKFAAAAVIIEPIIAIPITFHLNAVPMGDVVGAPLWMGLSILLASVLMSLTTTSFVAVAVTVGYMVIAKSVDTAYLPTLVLQYCFVAMVTGYAILVTRQRNSLSLALEQETLVALKAQEINSALKVTCELAHEINTPLAIIALKTETIEGLSEADMEKSKAEILANIKVIESETNRIAKMVQMMKRQALESHEEFKESV